MEVVIVVIISVLVIGLAITLASVKAVSSNDKIASKIASLVMKDRH